MSTLLKLSMIRLFLFSLSINMTLMSAVTAQDCDQSIMSIKRLTDPEAAIDLLDSIKENCTLDELNLKRWHHIRGMRCINLARYEEAQEHFQTGVILARNNPNDTFEAIFTNQIGVLKYSTKQRRASMKWFREAGELANKYEMKGLEAITCNNLGGMYIEAGKFDSAEYYLQQALEIWRNLGEDALPQYLFTSRLLATNAESQNDFEKAIRMYNDLIKASLEYEDSSSYFRALNFKSLCEVKIGRLDSAIHNARISLDYYSRDSSIKENLIMSLDVWANANQQAGNYKEAMLAREELRRLDKEIFNENLDNQLASKEAEFNTEAERQQRRIAQAEANAANQKIKIYGISIVSIVLVGALFALLFWQRQKRKLAEKDITLQKQRIASVLEGEERERTRIARELHDGVSQLLGALKMNLHASGVEDNQSINLLDDGINEVRSISHNLLPKQLSNQGLIPALEAMIAMVNKSEELEVTLSLEESVEPADEQTRINIYRICQELLTNAIKHSKASIIQFGLRHSPPHMVLNYNDNGVGISRTDLESNGGIGWNNILARLELLNAKYQVNFTREGLSLTFNFPHLRHE